METETTSLDSAISGRATVLSKKLPTWIKVGSVAAASAVAGGIAAAWFYRKALSRLQNAEAHAEDSNFRIPASEAGDYD